MTDRRAVRVVVRGRVQGVWFRTTCARVARAESVGGWVRNRADGSVEALFEGEASAVQRMQRWCGTGPTGAIVEGVEVSNLPLTGATSFEIR